LRGHKKREEAERKLREQREQEKRRTQGSTIGDIDDFAPDQSFLLTEESLRPTFFSPSSLVQSRLVKASLSAAKNRISELQAKINTFEEENASFLDQDSSVHKQSDIVSSLVNLGWTEKQARAAAQRNSTVDAAVDWLIAHQETALGPHGHPGSRIPSKMRARNQEVVKEGASSAFRAELDRMSTRDLRKTALGMGIGTAAIDDADDEHDTKEALIQLILARKEMVVTAFRTTLEGMRKRDLRKMALEIGISSDEVDDADDEDDAKEALVQLILARKTGCKVRPQDGFWNIWQSRRDSDSSVLTTLLAPIFGPQKVSHI
jgi:hypothetical protein